MILSSQAIALHSDFQQPSFDTMAVLVGGVGKIFGSFLGDASRDMINNAGDMVEASLVRAGQEILALIDHAASAAGRLVLRIGNESKITLQTAEDKITAVAENLSHHADLLLKKGGQEARLCLKGGVEGVQEVLLLTVPAAVRLAAADAVEAIGDGFTLARGGTPYSTLRKKLYRMLLDKESSPQKITDYLQARKNGNQGELWQCYHMVFVFYNHRDMPAENAFLWQLWIVMEAKLHAPRRNRGPVEWLRGADPWSEDFCAWVKHPREEQCQFLQRALSCLKWLPENPSIHDQAAIRPAIEDIIREALPHRVRALPAPALPAPALPPPALPPPALPAPALPAPAPPAAAPPAPAPPAPAPEDVAVQPPLQPGIWFIFKSQDGKVMGVKGPSKKENNAELLQCQEGDKVAFHQHFMLRVALKKRMSIASWWATARSTWMVGSARKIAQFVNTRKTKIRRSIGGSAPRKMASMRSRTWEMDVDKSSNLKASPRWSSSRQGGINRTSCSASSHAHYRSLAFKQTFGTPLRGKMARSWVWRALLKMTLQSCNAKKETMQPSTSTSCFALKERISTASRCATARSTWVVGTARKMAKFVNTRKMTGTRSVGASCWWKVASTRSGANDLLHESSNFLMATRWSSRKRTAIDRTSCSASFEFEEDGSA